MHISIPIRVANWIQKMTKFNVVFVLGAPGSGKGTQCSRITQNTDFVHLSAGDLLREERSNPKSEYGELIENHIRNGSIVPVAVTCSLLERAMNQSGKTNFLIDGFPRNKDNLDGWNEQMGEKAKVKFVLFFECSENVCVNRCLSRGAAGSGRSDDNEESLKKRFDTYVNSTMPIINHYGKNDLVRTVNADRGVDEVFSDVKSLFQ